jgi:magnesium-transporting ATPase (P-type)
VLQILALDIGTDMLPALGLGAEKPGPTVLHGRHVDRVVDRALLVRAFGVLGATEALTSMTAFTVVLLQGGWRWGQVPDADLAAVASGTAFAVIALSQVANAFACRSTTRPVWALSPTSNPLVLYAAIAELVLLVAFLVPPVSDLLGGSWPSLTGWAMAAGAGLTLVVVDGAAKAAGPARRTT